MMLQLFVLIHIRPSNAVHYSVFGRTSTTFNTPLHIAMGKHKVLSYISNGCTDCIMQQTSAWRLASQVRQTTHC